MAFPLKLKAEQLKQIYQAAMNDKDAKPLDDTDLKPASELTAAQADAMRPLPAALAEFGTIKSLNT
ncbi:MAG: hypothetical protein ACR2K5_04895 [Pseudolabrys sp.]